MALRQHGTASSTYRIGEVVRHRKYQYRGLVLGQRQRPRHGRCHYDRSAGPGCAGPWYQVQLEGSGLCVFVPEGQLELDRSGRSLFNPLAN